MKASLFFLTALAASLAGCKTNDAPHTGKTLQPARTNDHRYDIIPERFRTGYFTIDFTPAQRIYPGPVRSEGC